MSIPFRPVCKSAERLTIRNGDGRDHHVVLHAAARTPQGTLFACGDYGYIGRWDRQRREWTKLRAGGPPLYTIAARSDQDVWAFGAEGTGYRGNVEGSFCPVAFTALPGLAACLEDVTFCGVWFSPPTPNLLEVFGVLVGSRGTVLVWDGRAWEVERLHHDDGDFIDCRDLHLLGVSGLVRDSLSGRRADVVAVGTCGRSFIRRATQVGLPWRQLPTVTSADLYSVLLTPHASVAGGMAGTILRDVADWRHEPSFADQNIFSLSSSGLSGKTLFAGLAGGQALLRKLDGFDVHQPLPDEVDALNRWRPATVKDPCGGATTQDLIFISNDDLHGMRGQAVGHAGAVYDVVGASVPL